MYSAVFAAATLVLAGVVPQTTVEGSVTAISYNVQFLPEVAASHNKRAEPEYRARRIAEEMSKFEIVALQETFEEKHREAIKDGVRSVWKGDFFSIESPKPKNFLINGGCLLMSRFPIIASDAFIYTHFSKPEDYGFNADGFAAKGVIWARIARHQSMPNDYIDVFVTHLEARASALRPDQYVELAAFIKSKSDSGHAAILLGDLNTNGNPEERQNPSSQYVSLERALRSARGESGFTDSWPFLMKDQRGCTTEQETTESGKRIDYIWFSNPPLPAKNVIPVAIRVNGFLDPRVTALSDHSAVILDFIWPS